MSNLLTSIFRRLLPTGIAAGEIVRPPQTSPFDEVPLDLLASILSYLPPADIAVASVCRSWQEADLLIHSRILKDLTQSPFLTKNRSNIDIVFGLDSEISAKKKVEKIWKQVKHFGYPQEVFSSACIEENYQRYELSYIASIFAFWKKLPGGEAHLNSLQETELSDFKKALTLKDWMKNHQESLELTFLNLSGLQLELLPTEINLLKKLKHLFLDQNQLKTLPDNLDLPALETFSLGHNRIKELPNWYLPNLEELHLECNNIDALPKNWLPNLKILGLEYNPISNTCLIL